MSFNPYKFCENYQSMGKRFELVVPLWEKQIVLIQIKLIVQADRTTFWPSNMANKEHVYFWIVCSMLNLSQWLMYTAMIADIKRFTC